MDYYKRSLESLFTEFGSSKEGLSQAEAEKRLKTYGYNEILTSKRRTIPQILLRQFKSFIVWILGLTFGISYLIGHMVEAIVILFIIVFIVLLNFFMEFRATKEMDSLIKLAPKTSRVKRGKEQQINARELVPGDLLILKRGDIIGADVRLIECNSLSVDESTLTGESVPVQKEDIVLDNDVNLSDRVNMAYSGTPVTGGTGTGLVVATGKDTELGKISTLIQDVEEQVTPLQRRLDTLSKQIAVFAFIAAIIAFFIGLAQGVHWLEMVIFSMAIIVSGIPESLPTVVGICLAFGVNRMSRENAIVKSLPAVETLGTCSVICSDKTGTLTQNKMMVEKIFTMDAEVDVEGNGYSPEGRFLVKRREADITRLPTVLRSVQIGLFCNNADIAQEEDEWIVEGEPTEGALVALARKAGVSKDCERLKEFSFDPNRKMMSVIDRVGADTYVHSKGAPENIFSKAAWYLENGRVKKLTDAALTQFKRKNEALAGKGYRVLAVAYKRHGRSPKQELVEKNLVLVALFGIRDPPDPLAFKSIRKCQDAGIRTIMITGDSKRTAAAIGKELGIYDEDDNILTAEELDKIVDEKEEKEFLRIIDSVTVFARTTPEHKLKIVESLQKKGHIVAMTGDGVNDAPALKKADIGVSMGQRGTEVAKEASDLILKDDKFATIVKAVESGRNIYSNIRKFIYYLLVGSMSEVFLILLAIIAGMSLPLTALMVLVINLVTSEFPAIGLSLEKSNPHIMKQRPRDPKENILNDFVLMRIFSTVPFVVLGTVSLYIWYLYRMDDVAAAQTITFVTIVLFELFHTFNAKSWNDSIFHREVFSNRMLTMGVFLSLVFTILLLYVPFLQGIFGTVALGVFEWALVLGVSSSIILFIEFKKYSLKVEMGERERLAIS
ncbi:MAG: cation-translocating P-type ATPase [Nanobdellota archaeon]